MNFTPQMNDGTNVFVFGSNEAGRHGGGAAREAHQHWGAQMHVGFGLAGASFAIPTMDWQMQALPLDAIRHYVSRFLDYARQNPDLNFLVTPIGTGICGYTHEDIAPMFKLAPANCVLPAGWRK
ncbi:MAG TPA: hypothetical protein VG347_05855 [Verrucomicrobiae bacterium]|nr:hypothetical protein [Verrucomicrobiae bacterium]